MAASPPLPPSRRRRRRRPVLWLAIGAALALPVTEIVVLALTVREVGVLVTLGLLVVAAVLGGWLARREGIRTWRATREALAADRVPAAEVVDGMIVLVGGVLLLIPGFVSDLMGILALIPPTRHALRRWLLGTARRRLPLNVSDAMLGPQEIKVRKVTSQRGPGRPTGTPPGGPAGEPPRPQIVDGVVLDKRDAGQSKDRPSGPGRRRAGG